jgi:hypothetical protein
MDQDSDRHPGHRVPDDDSVPESAVRQQSVVCTSARLCRRSAIMGASAELLREVDGSRIAAVSVFFRSLATTATSSCALTTLCHQPWRVAWCAINNLIQNNAVTDVCCPRSDAEFVRLNADNRTMDFVPRFSNMHSSVESHAAR